MRHIPIVTEKMKREHKKKLERLAEDLNYYGLVKDCDKYNEGIRNECAKIYAALLKTYNQLKETKI